MTIAKVNFGRIDAESDNNLKDYFVDTGVLRRLAEGSRQFIIGRKGAGKTALFQQAASTFKNIGVVQLEFSDYAWEMHKEVRELGLPGENTYTASWVFTFLMAACQKWRTLGPPKVKAQADKVYRAIYDKESTTLKEVLFDKLKRLRKLELPNAGDAGGLGSIELDERRRKEIGLHVQQMLGISVCSTWPKS